MTYKEEFITFMVRSGVLTFGDFVIKSGRKTPYFVNTGNYKTGAQAAKLGDYYAACIQENLSFLAGPGSAVYKIKSDYYTIFLPLIQGIPLIFSCKTFLISPLLYALPDY